MRTLDVIVDARPLVGDRTGIGVHTAEIARRLRCQPRPLLASHAAIGNRQGLEDLRMRVDPSPLGVLWQQVILPRIDGDVLWGPHGTLPLVGRIPTVATVHDLTSITMAGRHRLKTIASFNLFIGRSLARATRIASVSSLVADEVSRGFAILRRDITIVPNGVDDFFSPEGDRGDALLYVGTLEPRKGLSDLLEVWETLTPRPPLILCGSGGWKTSIAPREGLTITGFVDRDHLRALYRQAAIFIYPSRYEGFGIPPLEAMACGAPVIATRTGAIPEYAGDAALLVDPGDRQSLRASIIRLLRDAELRRELSHRAVARARLYGWDRGAAIMEELLSEASRCA